MTDIFFSYKREDRARIEPLVELLEGEGLTVWWDPELVAGERFDEVIGREIAQARCVMVAWAAHSATAVWGRDAAGTGRDRGVLVPLSLDGERPPLGFGQYQTPDLTGWTGDPDDPRIRSLIAGVLRVVRGGAAPIPEPEYEPVAPPTPDPAPPGRRIPRVSRRRALQVGVAAGAVALTTAGGLRLFAPELFGSLPRTRRIDFATAVVDVRGVKREEPQSAEVFDVAAGGATLPFAVIPAGTFSIGSPDTELERESNEGPQKQITIGGFAIGRTAVTQAQWTAVVDAVQDPITQTLDRRPAFFVGGDLPVETVTWLQATEFCARLSRLSGLHIRLPSEAEWEYACRAGTTTPFHVGPTITSELANYCGTGGAICGTSDGKDISSTTYGETTYTSGAYADGPVGIFNGTTVPVGTYPPNRFGLHEMHGNVWEHCADVGRIDYRQLPTDGGPVVGTQDTRVLRGGAWSHNPAICRSAYRDVIPADSSGWQGRIGLRVVCELGG